MGSPHATSSHSLRILNPRIMVKPRIALLNHRGPIRNVADLLARRRNALHKRKIGEQDPVLYVGGYRVRDAHSLNGDGFLFVPQLSERPGSPPLTMVYYYVDAQGRISDECDFTYTPYYHYIYRSRARFDQLHAQHPDLDLGHRNDFLLKHE